MIVRSSKFLLLFFAATLLGAALFAVVAAWQLSRGPVSLSFLTPYVEDALSGGQNDVQVRLHDTVVTWAGLERTLDLRAVGLEILDSNGDVAAAVPELSVQLSLRALMRGLIAPTGLELFGPRLRVIRMPDGQVVVGIGETAVDGPSTRGDMSLIAGLLREPDPNSSTGYLRRVSIASALVEFEDRQKGLDWAAQRADIVLMRDENGIRADGTIVLNAGGKFVRFEVSGLRNAVTQSIELGISFDALSPAALASLDPMMSSLERFKLPVSGTVALSLSATLAVRNVNFDLTGGTGEILAAELYPTPLPIEQMTLRGRATEALNRLVIEEASIDLGGPVALVSGVVTRQDRALELQLEARVEALPTNDLARLWPSALATNARTWITRNIEDGVVDAATLSLTATTNLDDIEAIALREAAGEIDLRGMTIHYLRPMPPVRKVSGKGRFDGVDLVFEISDGAIGELKVVAGQVAIKGLTGPAPVETAHINATITGPVRETLTLLDKDPLNFISPFGIDPAQTRGAQTSNAVFDFPLIRALTVEDVGVAVSARLDNIEAPAGVLGANITQGNFDLSVDKERLVVKGKGALSGIPVQLTWTENFTGNTALRTRYEVQAVLDDDARKTFGLTTAPVLLGPVGVGLTYEIAKDGIERGAASLNLTDATLSLLDFGWQKPPGEPGRATVETAGRNGVLSEISKFVVTAPGLSAEGRATLASSSAGPSITELDLTRLMFADTDVTLRVTFGGDRVPDVIIGGNFLDLRQQIKDAFAKGDGKPPAMRVRIDADTPIRSIRLGEETVLQNPTGRLAHDGQDWTDISLLGTLSNGGKIDLQLKTVNGQRDVSIESDDGGGLFRALDWIDTIEGGRLRVTGAFIGRGADEKIVGQLDLEDFKLNQSSLGVRILSLASFSGISDAVSGTGISMRRAEMPFEVTDAEIRIGDSKARGADVGILASGRIDRTTDQIELKGEVAPFKAVNTLISNIPLVGPIVTGGSGAILAATFTVSGPLENPNVSVNPLSLLAPGILRRLVSGFGNGEGFQEGSSEQPSPAPSD